MNRLQSFIIIIITAAYLNLLFLCPGFLWGTSPPAEGFMHVEAHSIMVFPTPAESETVFLSFLGVFYNPGPHTPSASIKADQMKGKLGNWDRRVGMCMGGRGSGQISSM